MNKLFIILAREYNERIRKKSFWVMTILTPVIMLAMIAVPSLIMIWGGGSGTRLITVVDKSGEIYPHLLSNENLVFCSSNGLDYPEAENLFPEAYGVLVIPEDVVKSKTAELKFYTKNTSTIDLEHNLKSSVEKIVEDIRVSQSGVEGLAIIMKDIEANIKLSSFDVKELGDGQTEEKESKAVYSLAISYISSIVIYMFILLYGTKVLQGIVDEKQNRILELMVSSVKPFDLMMGKILGLASVAFTQILLWVVIFVIGTFSFGAAFAPELLNIPAGGDAVQEVMASANDQNVIKSVLTSIMDWELFVRVFGTFILMFIGGYLLYASLFAAIGSAVDNIQDTQQLQMPVTVPLVIAIIMMVAVIQEPNSQMAVWCSIIPFTSPIVMMARISYGVPVWEWIASIVTLYGSFIVTTWFASRVYRVGIFMYGKKPSIKDLIRWAKSK